MHPTLRESAVSAAAKEFGKHMGGRPILDIELTPDELPAPDVQMFRAVLMPTGEIRTGILYAYPGRNKTLYVGAEGDEPAAVKWLNKHGVPARALLYPDD